MDLDTDILRSSYLADNVTAGTNHFNPVPVLWEKTPCPDPVVIHDDHDDEDQYRYWVVHVENPTFGNNGEDFSITCSHDVPARSPEVLVIDSDEEQTELDKGVAADLVHNDNNMPVPNLVETQSEKERVLVRGSRKRRNVNQTEVLDKTCGTEKREYIIEEHGKRDESYHIRARESNPDVPVPENQIDIERQLVHQISPGIKQRKAMEEVQGPRVPVRFRFGHYTYDEKKQSECDDTGATARSSTVTQDQSVGETRRQRRATTWYIPEGEVESASNGNSEHPLASLSRYCEKVESRDRSALKSLTTELAKANYEGLSRTPIQRNLNPGDTLRLGEGQYARFDHYRNVYPGGMGWNPGGTPVSRGCVDNATANSLSYGNMLYSYHNQMINRRMMMNEMYFTNMQGRPPSWYLPSRPEVPLGQERSRKDSDDSSRSRLFGISISRSSATSCLADDQSGNKENQPDKCFPPNKETPVAMNDSGISTCSGNTSFEADTDIPSTSDVRGEKVPLEGASADSHWIGSNVEHRWYKTPPISSDSYSPVTDTTTDVFRRRRYILDASHDECGSVRRWTNLELASPQSAELQNVQTVLYPLTDQPESNSPPLLQASRRHSNAATATLDDAFVGPPLQDNSRRCNSKQDKPVRSADINDTEAMKANFNDVEFVPKQNTLSDFKALVDAFDQSPIKPVAGPSEIDKTYPALSAALFKNSSKKAAKNVVQSKPRNPPRTYSCRCCGRTDLLIKAIKRHNLLRYSCPVCQERFCLQDLLHKHMKDKSKACCCVDGVLQQGAE